MHGVRNGLIRFNTVVGTRYGDGIWTDWLNANERLCYNFIIDTQAACHSAIFVEASDEPNRIDHNVIVGCKTYRFKKDPAERWDGGHGIMALDSSEVCSDENIIFGAEGEAHDMRMGSPCTVAIEPPGNAVQLFNLTAARRYLGWEENGRAVSIDYQYDSEKMTLTFEVRYKERAVTKEIPMGQIFSLDDVFQFIAEASKKEAVL